ncbi:MAG TPA: PilZ domain-containing protein [Tepidisphaeraceae bacterium]|jgi:c-di-GMP-binding flagellar brake protein YcgR
MPDKNAEILRNAVSRNTGIVLSLPSAAMFRNHKSRLFCELEGGILIEAPRGDEALIADLIKKHTPCAVSFNSGGMKIIFAAPIRRYVESWKLNAETSVSGLLLEFPADIKATQRRSNYRVDLPADSDVSIRVWRISNSESLRDTPAAAKEVTTQIRDISAAGAGVKLIGTGGGLPKISVEDRLRVAIIYLGKTLIAEGKLTRAVDASAGNSFVTGIHFKRLEANIEGRQILSQLMRIVGELQRDELRRVKLGLVKKAS